MSDVNSDADRRIAELLDEIEKRTGVEVLYALESGSRAWGFASPDSDFDVRFIYREPAARAFSLIPGRDVMEEMTSFHPDGSGIPVDLVGWSLRKALTLGLSSNPQFAEWAGIHTVYRADPEFHAEMRELASHAAPRVLGHHYRGLAKKTLMDYLVGPDDPVGKKYLYAIRPIMASMWMVDNPHVGATPPVIFSDLRGVVAVPAAIDAEIDALLDWKMAHAEQGGRRRFPVLDAWIPEMISRLETEVPRIPEHHIDPEIAERAWRRLHADVFAPDPVEASLAPEV
jgi:uncharacterized protein